jgi:hypothetical protein
LKSTLQLEQLTCTSPNMIAYNLVRAAMYAAAAQSGLAPRRYSFARVRHVVERFLPFIAAAQTPEEAQAKGRRAYPRAAGGRPRTFPARKA